MLIIFSRVKKLDFLTSLLNSFSFHMGIPKVEKTAIE